MTNYYLLNLNNQLLLLSDEEMKGGDLFYHHLTGKIEKVIHYHGRVTHPYDKIIAGHANLPQIKFASQEIEDEYCKKSGWVNVDRMARELANIKHNKPLDEEERYYKDYQKHDGIVLGLQSALQLKQFSEEDMIEFCEWLTKNPLQLQNAAYTTKGKIDVWQSQRQPKLIKVELETESHEFYDTISAPSSIRDINGDVVLSLCKKCNKAEIELKNPCIDPKLTSNAYTITKIL